MSNSDTLPAVRRRAPVSKDDCPMAVSAELLGDRWSLLILREALYGVQRYDDMREDLDAPRSMLTDRLSKLVEHGLLVREPYREPGARTRHAYRLTEAGRDLALVFLALFQWGERHALSDTPVSVVDRETGRPLRVALVDDRAEVVPLDRATIATRPV